MGSCGPIAISFLSFGVAGASFVLSILAFRFARRAKRSDITQKLIGQAVEINEAFLRHNVIGPYARHLNIPDAEVNEFQKKAVLLLHQVNLLHAAWADRDMLGHKIEAAYQRWANKLVRPWIDADKHHLKRAWSLLAESKDLFEDEFINWLSPHLPLPSGVPDTVNPSGPRGGGQ